MKNSHVKVSKYWDCFQSLGSFHIGLIFFQSFVTEEWNNVELSVAKTNFPKSLPVRLLKLEDLLSYVAKSVQTEVHKEFLSFTVVDSSLGPNVRELLMTIIYDCS
jgi:hypothetical protein